MMEEDWLAAFMMSSILLNPQLFLQRRPGARGVNYPFCRTSLMKKEAALFGE
jgi:hypothetical protein